MPVGNKERLARRSGAAVSLVSVTVTCTGTSMHSDGGGVSTAY